MDPHVCIKLGTQAYIHIDGDGYDASGVDEDIGLACVPDAEEPEYNCYIFLRGGLLDILPKNVYQFLDHIR